SSDGFLSRIKPTDSADEAYSEGIVREKLAGAMRYIKRNSVARSREGERARRDVLVTHLGGIAKSGTQYARMFCQENKLLVNNAVSPRIAAERLLSNGEQFSALVAVDDVFGTGQSVVDGLKQLNDKAGETIRTLQIPVFLVGICGFRRAIDFINRAIAELGLPAEVYVSDALTDEDKLFDSDGAIFETHQNRMRAREIAEAKGRMLEKKWPLGYGDCEAGIVFFANCPNNSLPILYKSDKDWRPLFARV
ncbi:MAG: hypothetical protein WD049_00665, partial [Candidatus Paceibacterota bacterium]